MKYYVFGMARSFSGGVVSLIFLEVDVDPSLRVSSICGVY